MRQVEKVGQNISTIPTSVPAVNNIGAVGGLEGGASIGSEITALNLDGGQVAIATRPSGTVHADHMTDDGPGRG